VTTNQTGGNCNMHISRIELAKGLYEIFFHGLEAWDDFDLILEKLISENHCIVVEERDMVIEKVMILKSGQISFMLINDDMFGNSIRFTDKNAIEHLEKLAQNVIDSIKLQITDSPCEINSSVTSYSKKQGLFSKLFKR